MSSLRAKSNWYDKARIGPSRYFFRMRAFAIEGMICLVDERDGEGEGDATFIYPKEFLKRIIGLTYSTKNKGRTTAQMAPWQAARFKAQLNQLQGLQECVREAIDMGDPSDPKVREFWRTSRGRPRISLSGIGNIPAPKGFEKAPPPERIKPYTIGDTIRKNPTTVADVANGKAATPKLILPTILD